MQPPQTATSECAHVHSRIHTAQNCRSTEPPLPCSLSSVDSWPVDNGVGTVDPAGESPQQLPFGGVVSSFDNEGDTTYRPQRKRVKMERFGKFAAEAGVQRSDEEQEETLSVSAGDPPPPLASGGAASSSDSRKRRKSTDVPAGRRSTIYAAHIHEYAALSRGGRDRLCAPPCSMGISN